MINVKRFLAVPLSLSLLVFHVTCNDISVIYVTAQMCRRTEEVVLMVGLPTNVPVLHRHGVSLGIRRTYFRLKPPGVSMGACSSCPTFQGRISKGLCRYAMHVHGPDHPCSPPPAAHRCAVRDLESWLDSGYANHMHFREDLKFSTNPDGRISLEDAPACVPIPLGGESEGDKKILLARAQTNCYGLTGEATQNELETLACVYGEGTG